MLDIPLNLYEKAKRNFEFTVERMQKDLEKYAAGAKANQAAVDTRMNNLNTLVEFYTAAEEIISFLQMSWGNVEFKYNRLRDHSQRLVSYCVLHNVDPNMIFYYSQDELEEMYAAGVRIIPRSKSLVDDLELKFINGQYEIHTKQIPDDPLKFTPYSIKYYELAAKLNIAVKHNNQFAVNHYLKYHAQETK